MNFRHEVNRSQMETFVIDDVLYLMALGLFEKGCQQVIRHDLNFVFQYLAFHSVDVFDYFLTFSLFNYLSVLGHVARQDPWFKQL